MRRRGDERQGGDEKSCGENESCGELWQQREQKSCDKEERTNAVIRRRGGKESCDNGERRRAASRRRAIRVRMDVMSRKFCSNYVVSLYIMLIFRCWGVMPTFCLNT